MMLQGSTEYGEQRVGTYFSFRKEGSKKIKKGSPE